MKINALTYENMHFAFFILKYNVKYSLDAKTIINKTS